jgi:hypothetical protein
LPAVTTELSRQLARNRDLRPGAQAVERKAEIDLGPVKVSPGNVVAPLFTVTNPVGPQQHNIAQENVAPGQTAYPPLWGIIKVTFKTGVKPRLITSYAQIKKAQAAGQVTITRTPLVVNCPVV